MQQKLVILSLGQILDSKVGNVINAFADLTYKKSSGLLSFWPLHYAYSYLAYACDMIYYKQVESFKAGKIDSVQFRSYLKGWFGADKSDYEIDEAWNKISSFDQKAFSNVESLLNLASETNDLNFLIVSATNSINWEHTLASLQKKNFDFINNPRIKFALSFEEKMGTTRLPEMVSKFFSHNEIEYSQITSLHKALSSHKQIGVDESKFEFRMYNPSQDGQIEGVISK